MSVLFQNTKTGEKIIASGLFLNQGVKNPRRVFAFDNLKGHDAIDDGVIEYDEEKPFSLDKYRQSWRRFKVCVPWKALPYKERSA